MQRVLLENYILEQIYLIERESYYNYDLLEEGKILDFFKNLKSKLYFDKKEFEDCARYNEKNKNTTDPKKLEYIATHNKIMNDELNKRSNARIGSLFIAGLMAMFLNSAGIENPSDSDLNRAQTEALATAENNSYSPSDIDSEEWQSQVDVWRKDLQHQVKKYGFTDPNTLADFEKSNNNVTPQQQAEDDLNEFFFSYMSLSGDGVYPSTFDDMSQEDYEIFVDQFESFIEKNATTFNEKEYNQAMSLLYMTSASKRLEYPTEENPFTTEVIINNTKKGLTALQSYKNSIENVANTIGDISEERQGEALKVAQRIAQGQLDRLKELRESAEQQELDTSAYDAWIDDCKNIYMEQFGHAIDEDLDGNL